jgi:hypothetical protein
LWKEGDLVDEWRPGETGQTKHQPAIIEAPNLILAELGREGRTRIDGEMIAIRYNKANEDNDAGYTYWQH